MGPEQSPVPKKNRFAFSARERKRRRIHYADIAYFLGALAIVSGIWFHYNIGHMDFEQILYHLRVPLQGADFSSVRNYALVCVPVTILIVFGSYYLMRRITGSDWFQRIHQRYRRRKNWWASGFLLAGLAAVITVLGIPGFVYGQSNQSPDMPRKYVETADVQLTFPEKKRNVIYLFLESMESTFADPQAGGAFSHNLIPNLTKLAQDPNHIHFSHTEQLGGALQMPGLTWTVAGMVGQTAGIPIKVPIDVNSMGKHTSFLPGATSLGEILRREGYHLEVMMGSDASFGGRREYFRQHGDFVINDYLAAKEDGRIPEDYMVFWGYEDAKLFQYAKRRIVELSNTDEPFYFGMLTVDSHFPEGYVDPALAQPFDEPYANAIRQSDARIADFVKWFRAQPFAEDTTLIIAGDHLSMANSFFHHVPESYDRTVYNLFINAVPPTTSVRTKGRLFSTMDLFPTTLAAIGVEIEGDQLAYGVNLFSDKETLAESMGPEGLEDMLSRYSDFYNKTFLFE